VKIGKLIPNMVKLYDKITVVDNRVTKVENEMKVYNGNVLKVKQDMNDKMAKVDNLPYG